MENPSFATGLRREHGEGAFNWETTFFFAITFGIAFSIVRYLEKLRNRNPKRVLAFKAEERSGTITGRIFISGEYLMSHVYSFTNQFHSSLAGVNIN